LEDLGKLGELRTPSEVGIDKKETKVKEFREENECAGNNKKGIHRPRVEN